MSYREVHLAALRAEAERAANPSHKAAILAYIAKLIEVRPVVKWLSVRSVVAGIAETIDVGQRVETDSDSD